MDRYGLLDPLNPFPNIIAYRRSEPARGLPVEIRDEIEAEIMDRRQDLLGEVMIQIGQLLMTTTGMQTSEGIDQIDLSGILDVLGQDIFSMSTGDAQTSAESYEFKILALVTAIRVIAEKFMNYTYTEIDNIEEMPFLLLGDLVILLVQNLRSGDPRSSIQNRAIPAALYLTNNPNLSRLAKTDLNLMVDDYGSVLEEALIGESITEAYEEVADDIAMYDLAAFVTDLDPVTFRLYSEITNPSPKQARARREILDRMLQPGGVDRLLSNGGISIVTYSLLDLIDTSDEDDLDDILDNSSSRNRLYLELQDMTANTDPSQQNRAQQLHRQFQDLSDMYRQEHPEDSLITIM